MTMIPGRKLCSAMEEFRTEVRELYRFDLGTADVVRLRIAAIPGGAANVVDLRVRDLRIRAASVSVKDGAVPPARAWRTWLFAGCSPFS
jgi:hypothetical protein